MGSQKSPLDQIRDKLEVLEKHLQEMMTSTQADLELARALQRQLMPDRLPEVTGLKCLARYVCARELSSESFDILPDDKAREVWITASWSSSFGLSAVLLQSLVRMKSQNLLNKAGVTPEEAFDAIATEVSEAQKKGQFRLLVARLDMNSLKLKGCAWGYTPFLARRREASGFGEWNFLQPEALLRQPQLMERADASLPPTSAKAYRFETTLPPGGRLYLTGKEWNEESDLSRYLQPLQLMQKPPAGGELLDDLNMLVMRSEDHLKAQSRKSDVSVLAFELDARILHLA